MNSESQIMVTSEHGLDRKVVMSAKIWSTKPQYATMILDHPEKMKKEAEEKDAFKKSLVDDLRELLNQKLLY